MDDEPKMLRLRPGPSFEILSVGRLVLRRDRVSRAVDLGSGNLRNAVALAHLGYQVDAVDLVRGRSLEGVTFFESDVRDFMWNAPYDFVIASGVLQYLPPSEAGRVLADAARNLAPGGVLAITLSKEVGRGGTGFDVPSGQGASDIRAIMHQALSLTGLHVVSHEDYRKIDAHPGLGEHELAITKIVLQRTPANVFAERRTCQCLDGGSPPTIGGGAGWYEEVEWDVLPGDACTNLAYFCYCFDPRRCGHSVRSAPVAWWFDGHQVWHLEYGLLAGRSSRGGMPPFTYFSGGERTEESAPSGDLRQ